MLKQELVRGIRVNKFRNAVEIRYSLHLANWKYSKKLLGEHCEILIFEGARKLRNRLTEEHQKLRLAFAE